MRSLLLFLLIVIVPNVRAQYACSGICIPDFPECQISSCNTYYGVCTQAAKNPLPLNCCRGTVDCLKINNDPCVISECNLSSNTCEFTEICSGSSIVDPLAVCTEDRDCDDDDVCSNEKCIDNRCITSPNPSTNDPNCCQRAEDCPATPCKTAFCSSSFRCGYFSQPGCVVSYGLSDLYDHSDEEETESESEEEEEEEEDPGVGDIIGAIIGFIILGALVVAFIIVVILMVIQKIVRKLTSER